MIEMDEFQSFDEISIWSDGGPSHFKIYQTQFEMTELQKDHPKVKLTWNFFWANRGHNRCDGHAGNFKRAVRERQENWVMVRPKKIRMPGNLNL